MLLHNALLSHCNSLCQICEAQLLPFARSVRLSKPSTSNSWSWPRIYLDKYCIFLLTSVVLISDRPRRTPPSRHVTKIPSPQLLYFPHLQNCDARNSFRIRSYAKCRVSLTLSFPLPTLRAKKALQVFRNQAVPHSFALFCIFLHSYKTQLISFHALPHSLPKTPGVPPPIPQFFVLFPTSLPPRLYPDKLRGEASPRSLPCLKPRNPP